MKRIAISILLVLSFIVGFSQPVPYPATTTRWGFVPPIPSDATKFFNGIGGWSSSVTGSNGVGVSGINVTLGGILSGTTTINSGGFGLHFGNSGSTPTGVWTIDQDASIARTTPDILVNESGGGEAGRIKFVSNIAGDAGDIYIGRLAGSIMSTTGGRVLIGWRAGELATATTINAIGYEALRLATGNNNQALGTQALHNITTGTENVGVGRNTALFADVINRGTFIGNLAGSQAWATKVSDDNTMIGYASGTAIGASAFTAKQNTLIGSSILAAASGGYGDNNSLFGYNISNTGGIVSNNQLIGANIATSGGISNTTAIGQGITVSVSNVAVIGRADQNIHLGYTTLSTDQGSRVSISGRVAYATRTTAINTTLDNNDRTLFLTSGGLVITLPAASTCPGAEYRVVNQSTGSTFGTNYISFSGSSVNTIAANSVIGIQSDGTNWQRVL